MNTCNRPGCVNPELYTTFGLCRSHYHRASKARMTHYVSPEPVRQHLVALGKDGWSLRAISDRTGCSLSTLNRILRGRYRRMRQRTARRITSIPLNVPLGSARIELYRANRRIRALMALGHSTKNIGETADLSPNVIHQRSVPKPGETLPAWQYDRICVAFDKLCTTRPEGPDADRMRTMARRKGWAVPLAWDDDIDDPDGKPAGARKPACQTEGCDKEARSQVAKYCATHDHQARKQTFPMCRVEGCEKRSRTRSGGICYQHEVEGVA